MYVDNSTSNNHITAKFSNSCLPPASSPALLLTNYIGEFYRRLWLHTALLCADYLISYTDFFVAR